MLGDAENVSPLVGTNKNWNQFWNKKYQIISNYTSSPWPKLADAENEPLDLNYMSFSMNQQKLCQFGNKKPQSLKNFKNGTI